MLIKSGKYFYLPLQKEIDVYPLEPVGSILCVWGPDVGITFSGPSDRTQIWDTDEWQGHIPVSWFDDNDENWEFVE